MVTKRHYPEAVPCDFCGRSTYGIIYPDDKESVKCTSCHTELTKVADSVAVDGRWRSNHFRPFHSTLAYRQKKLFK